MNDGILRLGFPTAELANQALAALAPDDSQHAKLRVEGTTLMVEAGAESSMGVLRTIDDILACLRAAFPDV